MEKFNVDQAWVLGEKDALREKDETKQEQVTLPKH